MKYFSKPEDLIGVCYDTDGSMLVHRTDDSALGRSGSQRLAAPEHYMWGRIS
jgi:hypothetical protein